MCETQNNWLKLFEKRFSKKNVFISLSVLKKCLIADRIHKKKKKILY